jgi:2-phosphosulfolactate phosphatase
MNLDVLFTPADFEALSRRSLDGMTCVVFDVLRATSSMITALAQGASEVIPVAEISEALSLHSANPGFLLAGERNGLRIGSELTGSVPFHLGNSPLEFTEEKVRDKTIVMTTTNGTRALRACGRADQVFVGSFLNLTITAEAILKSAPKQLSIVCSGTFEEAAYEDILGAGALCELLQGQYSPGMSDAALVALKCFLTAKPDLPGALSEARNGKRLLSRPTLAADVAFCSKKDSLPLRAEMLRTGRVVRS